MLFLDVASLWHIFQHGQSPGTSAGTATLKRGQQHIDSVQDFMLQGVTQPPESPTLPPATFGFVDNAERLNSRAAMVSNC